MDTEGVGTWEIVESLWDGSFVAVACESEVRVTSGLSKLRRRSMWYSSKILIVEERDLSVRESLNSHPSNSFVLCSC